jgi:integrase/recombinase XerD
LFKGVVFDLEKQSASVPSKRIKDVLKGKKSGSFLDYADNYNLGLKKNGQISTYTKRKAIFAKLRAYLKDQDLSFDELTVTFLKGYERHLRDELGNGTNTIHFNLKVLRRVINEAIDEDLMDHAKNPFLRYKLKLEKTGKEYLTEEQLTQLEALELTPGTKVYPHRNMYVFSAYTGGLRILDVLLLKWEHIEDGNVIITTKETGTIVAIKAPAKALAILDLYSRRNPIRRPLSFLC